MKRIALVICLVGLMPILRADGLATGTWVRRPVKDGGHATMIIEAAGTGQKITFKVEVYGGGTSTLVVTTQLDGKDARVSVDGKPSGETMAIRMVDGRHSIGVTKMDGNPIGTSKGELSADGKVIKVENVPPTPGAPISIEYWDKK